MPPIDWHVHDARPGDEDGRNYLCLNRFMPSKGEGGERTIPKDCDPGFSFGDSYLAIVMEATAQRSGFLWGDSQQAVTALHQV